jgi:arylsulfatase/arylsulfatase A
MSAHARNAIVVIMDDLAWGDLACHGNPHTATPHLDAMHAAGTRGNRHCSGPLCSPARASLLTGRYHLRTRVIDTYCGRSMVDPDEPILAKDLAAAGFATGCFGKWHLGDCHPMRPDDQGFQESLVHRAGGIGQPGDHWRNHLREDECYFDPVLFRNGVEEQSQGYCTDIFFDAALDFIDCHHHERFFVYLATNAPHTPLIVSDEWADPYRAKGLPENHARLYGMVANIDWNMGRLRSRLAERGLAGDTLLCYTSDHGPCGGAAAPEQPPERRHRWNDGLRDFKGTCYEGGIRVPCLWEQPGSVVADADLHRPTHAIDVAPTIRGQLGLAAPEVWPADGRDLAPLLRGDQAEQDTDERLLFMHWHRGDMPVPHRNMAVIADHWKLVQPREDAAPELYDLHADPSEQQDLASQHPDEVAALSAAYRSWYADIAATRGPGTFDPPRIVIGGADSRTILNQNDWRLDGREGWRRDDLIGRWLVRIERPLSLTVLPHFLPHYGTGRDVLEVDGLAQQIVPGGTIDLAAGEHSLRCFRHLDEPLDSAWATRWVPPLSVELAEI